MPELPEIVLGWLLQKSLEGIVMEEAEAGGGDLVVPQGGIAAN